MMSKTPIHDFVKKYIQSGVTRLHMPGHKGSGFLGIEKYDITEIDGADVLYHSGGIIRESEDIAAELSTAQKIGVFNCYASATTDNIYFDGNNIEFSEPGKYLLVVKSEGTGDGNGNGKNANMYLLVNQLKFCHL